MLSMMLGLPSAINAQRFALEPTFPGMFESVNRATNSEQMKGVWTQTIPHHQNYGKRINSSAVKNAERKHSAFRFSDFDLRLLAAKLQANLSQLFANFGKACHAEVLALKQVVG